MGKIVKITCTFCKAEWECKTGCGILHGDLNRVAALYSPKQCREIKNHVEGEVCPLFDFGYHLSLCTHCRHVSSVPVLELKEKNMICMGICEQCMQEAELVRDIGQTACPVCHHKTLVEETVGMWD